MWTRSEEIVVPNTGTRNQPAGPKKRLGAVRSPPELREKQRLCRMAKSLWRNLFCDRACDTAARGLRIEFLSPGRCRRHASQISKGWQLELEFQTPSAQVRQASIGAPLSADPDQTIALRRRRLCHPVVPFGHAVELAGCALWAGDRRRGAPGAGPRRVHRRDAGRRDQYADKASEDHRPAQTARRLRHGRSRRRAIESVSPRHGHCPPVAGRRRTRGHRRVSHLRVPLDARRDAA